MTDDSDRFSDALPEIQALSRSIDPSTELEERTVAALRARGLLHPVTLVRRRWLTAAAAAALFIAGVATGRLYGAPAPFETHTSSGPTFALLLYGEPTANGASDAQLVDEYRRWAADLREHGRYVTGERLGGTVTALGASTTSALAPVRGFFVVSASTLEDATEVARSCPHVRRGGQIVVRPIDPT